MELYFIIIGTTLRAQRAASLIHYSSLNIRALTMVSSVEISFQAALSTGATEGV